jgi:hypothetical protein
MQPSAISGQLELAAALAGRRKLIAESLIGALPTGAAPVNSPHWPQYGGVFAAFDRGGE